MNTRKKIKLIAKQAQRLAPKSDAWYQIKKIERELLAKELGIKWDSTCHDLLRWMQEIGISGRALGRVGRAAKKQGKLLQLTYRRHLKTKRLVGHPDLREYSFVSPDLPAEVKMAQDSNQSVRAFQRAFERMNKRDYDFIYVLVDVHECWLKPNYNSYATEAYLFAEPALRILSKMPKIKLIMWTCSNAESRAHYNDLAEKRGIKFDYINENPDVSEESTRWGGDYSTKLYCNVLLDDKAGFDAQKDWLAIHSYLKLITKK